MSRQNKVEAFWQAYLASLPEGSASPASLYEAWSFCDNEEAANELGELVQAGTKTATCSLVWAYEAKNEQLPEVGALSIITNWDGEPLCIIETTEVQVKAFTEVDEKFAYDEGEGDRSLAYWRTVHWDVCSRECAAIGREPAETMPLLCERFRVIFPTGLAVGLFAC
jgi:uncharacterized protein YhfF